MASSVETIVHSIQDLYRADSLPWVVGYSGGKDSSATLQLIWKAIAALPESDRSKPIHVISTDTLVENPIIAKWVEHSLNSMAVEAAKQAMPIKPHRLTPALEDSFWVNLIGKGYPAPRPKFRWCTERLKISASNKFIQDLSEANGEAILVLGQRRGESRVRDEVMNKYEGSTRAGLSRNSNPRLSRVWVYLPVEDWTSDDVWGYLMTDANPWGIDNQQLFSIYRGATPDAECPIVVDSSTPSCGDSRFGCYVCTMVSQDKSMQAMIQNDVQKQWMQPILDFRNRFLSTEDREYRDFRRMNGSLLLFNDRLVHGPYTQDYRIRLLRELLSTQKRVQDAGSHSGFDIELISIDELDEIRRTWIEEKGEIEDWVPSIYSEIYDAPYPGKEIEDGLFDKEDLALLRQVCEELDPEGSAERYALTRHLLAVYLRGSQGRKRSRISVQMEKVLRHYAFGTEVEAEEFARSRAAKTVALPNLDIEPNEPNPVF